jgi:8-oxo-dGTP pyrophosphatase MutT (NUDIX family)
MVAASILPVALYKNKLYFLFGLENEFEDSAPGWSDFGGKVDGNEDIYTAALREGKEELTGILGEEKDIDELIQKGKLYRITHGTYHIHIFKMEYDPNLPKYYENVHDFLWNTLDKNILHKTCFEKEKIKWFSEQEMVKQKGSFRHFYQEIIDLIHKELPEIKKHYKLTKKKKSIKKKSKKNVKIL